MNTHRRPHYLLRPVPIPRWAIIAAGVVTAALVATTAWAAITPNYNAQCVVTPKANGGQVLDCDPIAAPSTTPSASPSPSSSPTTPPSPTASPSPSTTPSPSASTTAPATTPPASPTGPQRNCLANLAGCGFPNDLNTGPTAPLTSTSRTTYATAGETIVNTQINGCVEIRATGVTFRNVRFNASGCFWGVHNFSSGLTIVDSEITCGGFNGTAIGSSNFTLTRVDIHNCENGLDVGSNVTMTDSWIHDMETNNGAHTDGVQIGQGSANLTFRHNSILMAAPGATSAIIGWDEQAGPQQQNVVIDANLLSGGTYTIYCARYGASSTYITNNRFGIYEYGRSNACTGDHVSAWSGNVVDATNAPLTAS